MKQFDVLIIGAGIVGLTAASGLQQRGFSVALFDKINPAQKSENSRVFAINQASQTLLQDLAVWQHLDKEAASPYQKMYVWDKATGQALDFDSRSIASTQLGQIIEESVLKEALFKALATVASVQQIHTSIVSAKACEDSIVISDGLTAWQGRLLIIADGRDSPLRHYLKVPVVKQDYQQYALTAKVFTEMPHEKTAFQVFLKDGPLAFLPLKNPQQASIVWTTTPEKARKLKAMDAAAFNIQLAQAFEHRLKTCTLLSERQIFPLQMQHVSQYVGKNWLLAGDAAHTIHPLAGLGLNLGLSDLETLFKLIDSSPQTPFSSRNLQAYQRRRKYAVWKVIALVGGINSLFSNNFPPLVAARGLGFKFGNQLSAFKRFLIEQAGGGL